MKRLWKSISPCMSDVLGFQAILGCSEGLGVVDDSSIYKPLHYERSGMQRGPGQDRGHGRPFGHGGGPAARVLSSEIQEADVITGTAERVMEAFRSGSGQRPQFVLLTSAPCAAMIGTDLGELADRIQADYGIPAGVVELDGQRDYLYGMSRTLEAMGKLLLTRRETLPDTVNLLGCNGVDWSDGAMQAAEQWLAENGFTVLSRWGVRESAQRLKNAAAASVNLVAGVAGLRLAREMEREFQIPYVVGAPFGAAQCRRLAAQLRAGAQQREVAEDESGAPQVLILGEQMQGNAIRAALRARGVSGIRVCSFFEMDKEEMEPMDQKLVSEDGLLALLAEDGLRLVFGDPDYRQGQKTPWVPLPNRASFGPVLRQEPFSMVDAALDRWLDECLSQAQIGRRI